MLRSDEDSRRKEQARSDHSHQRVAPPLDGTPKRDLKSSIRHFVPSSFLLGDHAVQAAVWLNFCKPTVR
jgi:hypothetical protein